MLYICIGKPRTSCKDRASSVSFCPDVPENRPGEGATTGWIVFSKCFVVFSKCFVVFSKCRIVFRKSFLVSQKQPAECFRRLKTLKLRGLGCPFFRVVKPQNEGVKSCRLHPSQGVICFIGAPPARTALYTRKASGPRMYLSLEALLEISGSGRWMVASPPPPTPPLQSGTGRSGLFPDPLLAVPDIDSLAGLQDAAATEVVVGVPFGGHGGGE